MEPAASPSLAAQAANVALLERFDGMAGMRNVIRHIADAKKEWAGIPMPLGDESPLVIEPSYPFADAMMDRKPEADAVGDNGEKLTMRSTFWSWRWRRNIVTWEEGGKVRHAPDASTPPIALLLQTLGASDAWGVEQESAAVHTLAGMLRHRQFKQYMLTGMFMERSTRSHVSYVFRRLRPTVAISTRGAAPHILCALCMHPIGYYDGSWAGAMCPTDDVIAHLALMRGDEHMYWRRCNQHAPYRKEAGL